MDEDKNKNVAEADADINEHAKPDFSATTTSTSLHNDTSGNRSTDDGAAAKPPAPAKVLSPEETRTAFQTFVIMASLCAALFIAALDITIVATALPTITARFHSDAGYTWIGSAYLLTNAASIPSWGKFSDIWGRKPIILLAAGVFFVGSVLAATSINISMLIAARAIQGTGGGGLTVLVNICVGDLFSPRNRGKYLGIVAIVWATASGLGPILGGVFTEKVTWRWCFYINLPITGTVIIVLSLFLHLDNPRTPVWDGLKAVDWIGTITITAGTLMFLLGLEFGGVTHPWSSATVICLIVFGLFIIGLFVINEWKFAKYPITPIRLFSKRSNVAAIGVCFFHGLVFMSASYYLPLYFQSVLGATPLLSGVYLLPWALSFSIASYFTGIVIKATGKYMPMLYSGVIIMILGFGLYIDLPVSRSFAKIILYQIVAGIGAGPIFNTPLVALQAMVEPRDIATATSTFFFARILSAAISVVIGNVVFENEMQKKRSALVAALGPDVGRELTGDSDIANVRLINDLPPAQQHAARLAFWQSLRTMWIMYVALAGVILAVSLFMVQQKLSTQHVTAKTGLKAEEENRKTDMAEKKNGEANDPEKA